MPDESSLDMVFVSVSRIVLGDNEPFSENSDDLLQTPSLHENNALLLENKSMFDGPNSKLLVSEAITGAKDDIFVGDELGLTSRSIISYSIVRSEQRSEE